MYLSLIFTTVLQLETRQNKNQNSLNESNEITWKKFELEHPHKLMSSHKFVQLLLVIFLKYIFIVDFADCTQTISRYGIQRLKS